MGTFFCNFSCIFGEVSCIFWGKISIFLAVFLSFFAGFPTFFGEVFRTFWRISGTVSEGSKHSLPLTDGNAFVCSCCCHGRVAPLPSPKISPIFLKKNNAIIFSDAIISYRPFTVPYLTVPYRPLHFEARANPNDGRAIFM